MSLSPRVVGSAIQKERAFHLMKLEIVVVQLNSDPNKLPIRTLKPLFRTSLVVSAFEGNELVSTLLSKLQTDRKEAFHIACQLYKFGYVYPVEQNASTFKDDSTYYRMQSEDKWPSQCTSPTNMDYITFLEKKVIMKQKLTEHEQDVYERFSANFSRNRGDICKKAQDEVFYEERISKEGRAVMQGEERAFWRLHRPPPGEPLVMESSIQKRNMNTSELTDFQIIQDLDMRHDVYRRCLKHNRIKTSHSAELIISYVDTISTHDPFLKKNASNPWYGDARTPPASCPNRFQLWSVSFDFLIQDKLGRELFMQFLATEVSTENLNFCEEVTNYKMLPKSQLKLVAPKIFKQYIGSSARSEINIDGKTLRAIKERMENPDRYTFDPAQNYIYDLMRKDSYSRFLKSHFYINAAKKNSIERKVKRVSRYAPHPLNALSIHNTGKTTSFEAQPLTRSNSLDIITESLVSPMKNDMTGSHLSFDDEEMNRRSRLFRNSSGLKLTSYEFCDVSQMDEVEENSANFIRNQRYKFINSPGLAHISDEIKDSFEENDLTTPMAPKLKFFPKPKISNSHSDAPNHITNSLI